MRLRLLFAFLLVMIVTLAMTQAVPAQAQARKVIEITATSFKFEPNQITVNEGDTVVIRLRNNDTERRFNHAIASRFFVNIPLTVRSGQEGTDEGRKFVRIPAGQTAEFEFTARGTGSYAFICSVFIHSFAGMTGAIFVKPAGSN